MTETPESARIPVPAKLSEKQFQTLRGYIETELGIKMPPAKRIMLESRLQKRLRALRLQDFDQYLDLVFSADGESPELVHMIDSVTTNKTDFFREPDHFDRLLSGILPTEYRNSEWGRRGLCRVWSTASSSGEEPYTLAMVLEEFARSVDRFQYGILATDISTAMLDRGRRGVYPEERIAPVPEAYRKRYLLKSKDKQSGLVRIRPELRRRVLFHRLNLMGDRFDIGDRFEIIFCRNVIIYFDRENQRKLLSRLVDHLVPGGYLFLGHSETLAGMDLPLNSYAPTIYRRPL